MYDVAIIGPAIIDILASPAGPAVFETGSMPMDSIKMSYGGDALNESVVLAKLGKRPQLVSSIGDDEAGKRIIDFLKENNISDQSITIDPSTETGINIVLIDEKGARHFLTNPRGSLRTLDIYDIDPYIDEMPDVVCFAGMFISSRLTIDKMQYIFRRIKEKPRTLIADMTKAKNGERIEDLKELMHFIDIIVPNEDEISLLTGESDPYINIKTLLDAGVSNAIIKRGAEGCLLAGGGIEGIQSIPAVPGIEPVDTTGAGDTFAAALTAAYLEGRPLAECAAFANRIAAITVQTVGATDGIRAMPKNRLLS